MWFLCTELRSSVPVEQGSIFFGGGVHYPAPASLSCTLFYLVSSYPCSRDVFYDGFTMSVFCSMDGGELFSRIQDRGDQAFTERGTYNSHCLWAVLITKVEQDSYSLYLNRHPRSGPINVWKFLFVQETWNKTFLVPVCHRQGCTCKLNSLWHFADSCLSPSLQRHLI